MRETDLEPALHPELADGVAAEPAAASSGSIDRLRDSVWTEPEMAAFAPAGCSYQEQLALRAARVSDTQAVGMTVVAGVLGGLLAVPGVFLAGNPGFGVWGAIVGAPVVEELLKQAGMLLVLERYPWFLKRGIQFLLGALLSSLLFATIENLIYAHVYLAKLPPDKWAETMAFRWCWCTVLHVSCALIASAGLWRAWRRSRGVGRAAQLSDALPPLIAAMLLHGGYNLTVTLL